MELIFVYNADSSLFSQIKDLIHKSVSPKTYPCRLCSLTFGFFSQKEEWSEFINSLKVKTQFLHKDEFLRMFPKLKSNDFPAVFLNTGKYLTLVISKEEIERQNNLDDLMKLVNFKTEQILSKANFRLDKRPIA